MRERRLALTPALVRQIRDRVARGASARAVALALGLPERTVQHAVSGHTFLEAGGPVRKLEAPARLDLTDSEIRRIRTLRGFQTSEHLARMFNCSESTIRHIWTGRMHARRG